MQKEKQIKGYAVLFNSVPYTPSKWLGAYTIFQTIKDAKYWAKTRVHPSNNPKIVKCEIKYDLSKRNYLAQ